LCKFKLAVGDLGSPLEDVDMQQPEAIGSPPNVQYTNNSALPNQQKLDEQGHLARADVSCRPQEMAQDILPKKVLVIKKAPLMISPNLEQQHYVDCNNNMKPQMPSAIESHMPLPQIYPPKHFTAHPLSPLNINTQFHPPQFVNHLNWSHPQFH
jgi:hypothetical protein